MVMVVLWVDVCLLVVWRLLGCLWVIFVLACFYSVSAVVVLMVC